jgi:hypothetical protein
MILHSEDILDYPGAIYDFHTSNKSFVRYVALLKAMGVKNAYFALALMQPELQGVNPHDPNLDELTKIKIWQECMENPWYFLREVIRIKAGDMIPYGANRGNMALMWLFLNHIDMFLIQPRQTGKSVAADCLMLWLIYFGCYNIEIQLITKDANLRTTNVNRMKAMRDGIPQYLIAFDKNDPDNTEVIGYAARKMLYTAKVPRASEIDAEKVGRGATGEILQFDEAPHINHIGITLPSALGSSTAARENAKRNNTPYGILYTTTAGRIDSRDGRYVYDMLQGAAIWNEGFLDAGSQERLEQMVLDHGTSDAPLMNCTFSHRQLGYTDAWLWETMARNKASGELAERDYLNRWTNGTGSNPISAQLLERIAKSERDPNWIEHTKEGYMVRWYIPEAEMSAMLAERKFIMGLDTSDAIGRDGIDMVIIDTRTLSVVASGTFNRTSIYRWISFLGAFMIRYPNITLIPERKSSAQSIVDGLVQILDSAGIDPFRRIFNHLADNKEKYGEELTSTANSMLRRRMYETHKQYFGFNTTGDSRTQLYVDVLNNTLEDAAGKILDKKLSGELRGLVVKNGRVDHQTGGHDDSIIAYLMANWMLIHGRNLQHYGITSKDIRTEVVRGKDVVTVADMIKQDRARKLRANLDSLFERLNNVTTDAEAIRLEYEIRHLMTLSFDIGESAESIQELIDAAAAKRRDRLRTNRYNHNSGVNWNTQGWQPPPMTC